MNFLENLKKRNYQLQLEKLIVGIEEPIFIKGLGNIIAKVDSGNGGYNVIHGEDFYYQGDVVIFTSYDEDGNSHKISKKVQDKITINIGGGCTEDRPVVLFDVKFANDEYLNVPFTVGNRASNKNKALLGKEFLVKELDALIDVSNANLADKNIEIEVPIKEENLAQRAISKPARYMAGQKATTNITKKNPSGETSMPGIVGKNIKGAWNAFLAFTSPNSKFFGKGGSLDAAYSAYKAAIDEIQKSDKYLIFKALNEEFEKSGQPIKPFVNNPQVFKLLDYMGFDYENNSKALENEKNKVGDSKIPDVNKETSETSEQSPENNTTEEGTTTTDLANTQNSNNYQMNGGVRQISGTETPKLENTPEQKLLANKRKGGAYPINHPKDNDDIIDVDDEEIEEDAEGEALQQNQKEWNKAQEDVAKDIAAILYLVIFDGNQTTNVRETLSRLYPSYKGTLESILEDIKSNFNYEIGKDFARDLVAKFKENGIITNIALVSGKGSARHAQFLATNFQPTNTLSFLKQPCSRYADILVPKEGTKEYEQIKETDGFKNKIYKTETFARNPIFGFNKFKQSKEYGGMPDEQIREWLENKEFHKGYNVKGAFDAFMFNTESDGTDDLNSDIEPEKLELAIKEKLNEIIPTVINLGGKPAQKVETVNAQESPQNAVKVASAVASEVNSSNKNNELTKHSSQVSYDMLARYYLLSKMFKNDVSLAAKIIKALRNNPKLIDLYLHLYDVNEVKNEIGDNLQLPAPEETSTALSTVQNKAELSTEEKKALRQQIRLNEEFGIAVVNTFAARYNLNLQEDSELTEEEIEQLNIVGKEILKKVYNVCIDNIEQYKQNPTKFIDSIINKFNKSYSEFAEKEGILTKKEAEDLSRSEKHQIGKLGGFENYQNERIRKTNESVKHKKDSSQLLTEMNSLSKFVRSVL